MFFNDAVLNLSAFITLLEKKCLTRQKPKFPQKVWSASIVYMAKHMLIYVHIIWRI